MNYIEALQALVDGKKIKKKDWADQEYYFIADNKIYNSLGMECSLTIDDEEELTEDTWEIYMDERDKLIQAGKRWELYNTCYSINCEVCMLYKPKLCKCCKKIDDETLLMTLLQDNRISDDEVDKLYNAVKGELDA